MFANKRIIVYNKRKKVYKVSDEFGGIDVNKLVEKYDPANKLNIPDLDEYRSDLEARKEVQRKADELAKKQDNEEKAHQERKAYLEQELVTNFANKRAKKRKVVKRIKITIAVAIITTAIIAGMAIVKEWPNIANNFPNAIEQAASTKQEMSLDDLKAALAAGYTEVQIDGYWYVTKDAIKSMEEGIPLDESLSLQNKAQSNIDENDKIR